MSDPLEFDVAVIGAGVVGLAIGKLFAESGAATVLLEGQSMFGTGVSARNSEVIHAGLYYFPGSLKAQLCAAGNAALYRYCETRGIAHKRLGKLIVAVTDEELPVLDSYQTRAKQNGVMDLVPLDAHQVNSLEPEVQAVGGLFSPSTGIVDSHGLMKALLADFEIAGGVFARNSPVLGGKVGARQMTLDVGGSEPCQVVATTVINAAGLGAQRLANSLVGFPADKVPALHYAIGHYYAYSSRVPFKHLLYPVAGRGGLGIHLTFDLGGQARFGPDISWRNTEDFSFDESSKPSFMEAIKRYWPNLESQALYPAYTGIRPKLWGPAKPDQDFYIQTKKEHGIDKLVNLYGIESPGLTSALSLANFIYRSLSSNAL